MNEYQLAQMKGMDAYIAVRAGDNASGAGRCAFGEAQPLQQAAAPGTGLQGQRYQVVHFALSEPVYGAVSRNQPGGLCRLLLRCLHP